MKVLLLWADHSSANLGVRVLAEGTDALIRSAYPDSDVEVTFHDFRGLESGVRLTPIELARLLVTGRGRFARLIRASDLVVDTGAGDSFTDIYGFKRFSALWGVQRAAIRMRKPYVLSPQTVGPFTSRVTRYLGASNLRKSSMIMSRDSASTRYAESLGVQALATTDVVFALPTPEASTHSFDVILNVSGLLWQGNPHVDSAAYRTATLDLCRRLLDAGRTVTLFAHVLETSHPDNDVPAIYAVADAMSGRVGVFIPKDLQDARQAIASSQIVIGARMHATLNAISVGVPAIPWAYSRKFAPLLEDLGWAHVVDARGAGLRDAAERTMELIEAEDLLATSVRHSRAAGRARLTSARAALSALDVPRI